RIVRRPGRHALVAVQDVGEPVGDRLERPGRVRVLHDARGDHVQGPRIQRGFGTDVVGVTGIRIRSVTLAAVDPEARDLRLPRVEQALVRRHRPQQVYVA